ncbi:MAG: ABC transporter permease [Bacteroidota bacterium]
MKLKQILIRDKYLLLMFLPGLIYYAIFKYGPMYGLLVAFQDFSPWQGIMHSDWVGLKHFIDFVSGPYFGLLLRNTVLLNVYSIVFGFPVPIIFALLLNEVGDGVFKRMVQSFSYLPHFVSTVVIVGIFVNFLTLGGTVNNILASLGFERFNFMGSPEAFRTIFTILRIWSTFGWNAIIYIAAISNIDPSLYEAAMMDGAGRLHRMWHVTIPGIMPSIVTLFLLRIGHVIQIGFETVYLMQNSMNMATSDVFATFVYRRGIIALDWSYAAAVGFFESMVGLVMVVIANRIARRVSETSLW